MAKVLSFVSWHDELYNLEFDDFWSTGGSRRGFSEFWYNYYINKDNNTLVSFWFI